MSPKKTVRKETPVKKAAERNSQNTSVKKQPMKAQLKPTKKRLKEQGVSQLRKAASETALPTSQKVNPKLIHRQHPFTAVIELFACSDVAHVAETKSNSLGRASKRYMVEAARELKELGLL